MFPESKKTELEENAMRTHFEYLLKFVVKPMPDHFKARGCMIAIHRPLTDLLSFAENIGCYPRSEETKTTLYYGIMQYDENFNIMKVETNFKDFLEALGISFSMLEDHTKHPPLELANILEDNEVIASYGITNHAFLIYHCIIRNGSSNIEEALRNTLNRILEKGTEDDVFRIMGAIIPNDEEIAELEESNTFVPLEFGYVIPGNLCTFTTDTKEDFKDTKSNKMTDIQISNEYIPVEFTADDFDEEPYAVYKTATQLKNFKFYKKKGEQDRYYLELFESGSVSEIEGGIVNLENWLRTWVDELGDVAVSTSDIKDAFKEGGIEL